METLCITNGSKLAPMNCLQLVPSRCAQPKTKIQKDIKLGHRPTCDWVNVTTENVTNRGFGIRIRPNIRLNPEINAWLILKGAEKWHFITMETGKLCFFWAFEWLLYYFNYYVSNWKVHLLLSASCSIFWYKIRSDCAMFDPHGT